MSVAPLQGVRVVDFTRVLAGPHCTKALRDLGADVTKIEPPAGDLGRFGLPNVNGVGLYYVQQNAGKRNLSLDLNFPEARQVVAQLCREADVIVENFRPGTLARFGFGYEDVKAFNPKIIYVSLSGYGANDVVEEPAGVCADRTGRDRPDGDCPGAFWRSPVRAAWRLLQSCRRLHRTAGVIAVLAALQHRNRTGEGQHVDVSMAATMLSP